MTFLININSIDRTSEILFNTFKISDYINQQVNTCTFETKTFKPELNQEIEVFADEEKIFAGVIVKIETQTGKQQNTYKITCKDYTQYLNRRLISETFYDTTVNDIIEYLITEYASDFTFDNVDADVPVTQITFNRITMTQALQSLADLVNYYWYVDYNKDIHFFAKNSEVAPFNLDDAGGYHNWNSLSLTEDFSQIRNQVYVIGGEYEAEPRTETYVADGDQRTFPLAYKYKTVTAVKVNSVSLVVGIDGLDEESLFDVFWSYQQKYIRFKEGNYPDADDVVEITGTPLLPVIVKVPDVISISTYGLYEYKIIDKNITSRDDAIARAVVELEAYAGSIDEGSFVTVQSGLKSGQLININIGGKDEDFIIQAVTMSMLTPFEPRWEVKLATTRTLGIIQFLQTFLVKPDDVKEGEVLLELQQLDDTSESTDSVSVSTDSPPYLWADATDPDDEGKWNLATWS